MGGWINIIISGIAAYSFYRIHSTVLMVLSIANCMLSFWSFGVMHNYASSTRRNKAAILRKNMEAEGRLDSDAIESLDRIERSIDPHSVPNWISTISMASFVFSIVLLVIFFFKR
ncbi:MAG: hypothetical protein C4522_17920 [Desulfobacteraceae bacterium]|nr:MAG: hypothetical protein C4522_17920 [Desulfobacteraceae bacterium]